MLEEAVDGQRFGGLAAASPAPLELLLSRVPPARPMLLPPASLTEVISCSFLLNMHAKVRMQRRRKSLWKISEAVAGGDPCISQYSVRIAAGRPRTRRRMEPLNSQVLSRIVREIMPRSSEDAFLVNKE